MLPGMIYQELPSSSDAKPASPKRSKSTMFDSKLSYPFGESNHASASPPPSQASRSKKYPTILTEAALMGSTRRCVVASRDAPLPRGLVQRSNGQCVGREKACRLNENSSSSPAPIQEQCKGIIRAAEQQRRRNLGNRDISSSSTLSSDKQQRGFHPQRSDTARWATGKLFFRPSENSSSPVPIHKQHEELIRRIFRREWRPRLSC